MRDRKPFDFLHFHVIYRATPGGLLRPDWVLIAEN
jgi:hypothetical protein